MTEAIKLLLFPAMMAFAASSDLLTMTIPNRVSLIMLGGFCAVGRRNRHEPGTDRDARGAGLLVLAIAFAFFARGWIGGGDAKLAAATALWFGFEHLMEYLVYGSIFGGALTLLLLLQYRAFPLPGPAGRAAPGPSGCTSRRAACLTASRSRRRPWWSIPAPPGCRASPAERRPRRPGGGNVPLTRFRYA